VPCGVSVRQVPGCGNVCPESAAFREDFAVQEGTVAAHFPHQVRSRVSAAFTALFTAHCACTYHSPRRAARDSLVRARLWGAWRSSYHCNALRKESHWRRIVRDSIISETPGSRYCRARMLNYLTEHVLGRAKYLAETMRTIRLGVFVRSGRMRETLLMNFG
jgi:hypothetical protein